MTQTLPPEVVARWRAVVEAVEAARPAVERIVAAIEAAEELSGPAYLAFVDRAPRTVASQDAAGEVFLARSGKDRAWLAVQDLAQELLDPVCCTVA